MPVNGIKVQNITDIRLDNVENINRVSIQNVMGVLSEAVGKAVTPAGPSVTEQDSAGGYYTFTPYYSNTGDKMIYLETRSPSGVVSHMPLKHEKLEPYCSRKGLSVPELQYNC